ITDENWDGTYYVDENGDPIKDEQSDSKDDDINQEGRQATENTFVELQADHPGSSFGLESDVGSSKTPVVRDEIPFFNVGGDSGYITFEENLQIMCRNLQRSDDQQKGMMFTTKADLIHHVKSYHVKNHSNFRVHESTKHVWSVYYMKRDD